MKITKSYLSTLKTNMKTAELRKKEKRKNSLLEGTKHNDLMSGRHKNTCQYLNHAKHLLISAFTITECGSISEFN